MVTLMKAKRRLRNCYACGKQQCTSSLCKRCSKLASGDHGVDNMLIRKDPERQERIKEHADRVERERPKDE